MLLLQLANATCSNQTQSLRPFKETTKEMDVNHKALNRMWAGRGLVTVHFGLVFGPSLEDGDFLIVSGQGSGFRKRQELTELIKWVMSYLKQN